MAESLAAAAAAWKLSEVMRPESMLNERKSLSSLAHLLLLLLLLPRARTMTGGAGEGLGKHRGAGGRDGSDSLLLNECLAAYADCGKFANLESRRTERS